MRARFHLLIKLYTLVSLVICILVAQTVDAKEVSPHKIVVFGDSISAAYGIKQEDGWVALLQQRLTQQQLNYQVVNASISGETTSGGLSRFDSMLQMQKPNIVILELGANDGLRGLSLVETKRNLESMIQQAQKTKAKVLLLGMKIPPNYGLTYSRQFSENYQDLAKQYSTQLVPFFLDNVAGNPELIQPDGLHPTAVAQPKLLENIWSILNQMLKSDTKK